MSAAATGIMNIELIPSSEGKNSSEQNKCESMLSLIPFGASASSSKGNEQLLSSCSSTSNILPGKGTETSLSNLATFSLLPSVQDQSVTVGTKQKRKSRSKAGPKSRKRKKKGASSDIPDADRNLDTDLFAIIEGLNTDKNLDSDSSTNTIIIDDTSKTSKGSRQQTLLSNFCINGSYPSDEKAKSYAMKPMLKNANFQAVNEKQLDKSLSSYLSPFTSNKETNNLKFRTDISTNFYNNNKGRLMYSLVQPQLSENQSQGIFSLGSIKGVENSQKTAIESKSSVSLLRGALNKNASSSNKIPVLPTTSTQPILQCLMDKNNKNSISNSCPNNKTRKKATKILFDAQVSEVKEIPQQSSVGTNGLVPNLCQKDHKINYQSVYASMGLDEDLCDSDLQNSSRVLNSNSASKETCKSFANDCENNPLSASIKEESSSIVGSNEEKGLFDLKTDILSANDLHVSMIFEAEPSCDEEDVEDDLPLSLLKDQISMYEIVPKMKQKSEELNTFINEHLDDIPSALFIKKELIEDEIVSESQAVSSENLLTISNGNRSSKAQSSYSASQNDFTAVKIKTEPNTDFSYSESVTKKSSLASVNSNVTLQFSNKAADLVPKELEKGKQKNSILEPTVNNCVKPLNNVSDNNISQNERSYLSKSQYVDKLSIPSTSFASGSKFNGANVLENFNDLYETSCSTIYSDFCPKESEKSFAFTANKSSTCEIVDKKSKETRNDIVEKSLNVHTESLKSLPEEMHQDLKSCNDDFSFNQPVTDTDTESNSSRKRGKRKKSSKQSVNIDENVPITLLIKRQKSDSVDSNAPDSFLCTSVNKSDNIESKSIVVEEAVNSVTESHDANLPSTNLESKQKNLKKQRKQIKKTKKQSENIPCDNITSKTVHSENMFLPSKTQTFTFSNDDAHPNNSQSNLNRSERSESTKAIGQQAENSSSVSGQKTVSTEQKCDTYVYMTFEEHSPVEEITEEDMNSVVPIKTEKDASLHRDDVEQPSNISSDMLSVIKNIKQENSVCPESNISELSNISSCLEPTSSQVEETFTLNSQASGSNMDDESSKSALSNFSQTPSELNPNSVTKKKKRRPKSNGWCKKKKSKAKGKNLSSLNTEVKEPELETNENLPLMASTKMPIVIIKNFAEVKFTNGVEKMLGKDSSLCSEQEPVTLPIKGKKKSKLTALKRKKSARLAINSSNNESQFQNSVPECNKDADNSKLADSLKSETVQLSEKVNLGNHLLNGIVESALCKSSSENNVKANVTEVCDSEDNITHSGSSSSKEESRSVKFPSLDVDQIAQEIATYEAILQNFGKTSHKSVLSGTQENVDKYSIKAPEYDIRKELNDQSTVSNPNILEAFNSSFKSVESESRNSFELNANIQVKKEIDTSSQVSSFTSDCFTKNNEIAFSHNSSQKVISERDSPSDKSALSLEKADTDSLSANLACMKKEKNANNFSEGKSINNLTIKKNGSPAFVSSNDTVNCPVDKMLSNDSIVRTSLSSEFYCEVSKNLSQKSANIDAIALSIKKEISERQEFCNIERKTGLFNYVIKDQNDLIQKVCGTQIENSTVFENNLSDTYSKTSKNIAAKLDTPTSQPENISAGDDDEIQVLHITNQKSSNDVPYVDLTGDNCISDSVGEMGKTPEVGMAQLNTVPISTRQIGSKNLCDELIKVSEAKNASLNNSSVCTLAINTKSQQKASVVGENKQTSVTENQDTSLSLTSDVIADQSESLKIKADVLTHNFIKEKVDEKDIPFKTSSSLFITRDKYIEEYLKHPFPPSVVLYNKKQRSSNKMYMRINSKAWNLSIDEVESRLKLSETSLPQFGKKLGDIVKLEKYPVSISEVECYHRILGVAPSQKLLSKCFKSPDKKTNIFKHGFNVFPGLHAANVNKFEIDEQLNVDNIAVQELFQGISETKMMYSSSKIKNNSAVYEIDCPSTDTKDSCDSHISNISSCQNSDSQNNLFQVKTNAFISNSTFTASNSCKNPTLSCTVSNFNQVTKNDKSNFDSSLQNSDEGKHANKFNSKDIINLPHSQNILNLTLPSQEVINSIVNNKNSNTSYVEMCDNISKSFPVCGSDIAVSESYSMSNSYEQEGSTVSIPEATAITAFKVNNESKSPSEKKYFDIDLPVIELRKILEAAGSLLSGKANHDKECPWKSKATFEYNHTQSVPVIEISPNHNAGESDKSSSTKVAPCNNFAAKSISDSKSIIVEDSSLVEEVSNSEKKTVQEDSDDDYVDNEPINNDSDNDRNDDSSHTKGQVNEERTIPQYKSKWEKIMERKCIENKEKEKINQHLLKDCFPVSSSIKAQSKKSNTFNKNCFKSSEEPENSKTEKISAMKQKNKSKKNVGEKIVKQNDKVKRNSGTNAVKRSEKSKKSCKKLEKSKTKSVTEKATKKVLSSKKNKTKADDVSNLFVPDKSISSSRVKKSDLSNNSKSERSKLFYGNRVTNRGTFLTESSSPAELLKKIKIPKKKIAEIPQKPTNMRSEEFHSMVKSPDINIESTFRSSYANGNKSMDPRKNNECYRSPLENTSPPNSSHFIRTKEMRDRKYFHMNSQPHLPNPKRIQNLKAPISSYQHPVLPHSSYDSSILGRKTLLTTPSSVQSHLNNESMIGRNISHLDMLPSMSPHHPNNENILDKKILTVNTQLPPKSSQSNKVIIQSILSALKPPVPKVKDNVLPFSDVNNWDTVEFNSSAYGCNESSFLHSGNVQPAMSDDCITSVNTSYENISPPKPLDPLNSSIMHPIPNVSVKNQFEPSLNSASHTVNSPSCTASVNSNSQIAAQQPRKASCLVPQILKTMVGHETIDTHNVRLLMLEWSVDWLVQQQQFPDPPPISNALKKVVSTYDSFEDYYNTYFPLMLLDTWHRIYVSWTHLNQACPYSCQITSYSVKKHFVSVECQTVFNTAAHPKGVFPDEGSILMVKYATKANYTIKILGYVTHVKTRRFNDITDSKLFSSLRLNADVNPDVLQVLSLTYMGAYNSEDIDKRQQVRIHVLCNVKPTLKQNDALLYIKDSPLQRSILNPVADGLLSFTLTPRNSPLEKVNECVREITKGILSPHPLPLLTVVRAKPESDRLNIIPQLIEKMKSAYRTKVLLCVRTVRALGDIAANICLHQSLKLVIVNKRCDTNLKFQKYLLDEIATNEINKISEDKSVLSDKLHVKNEIAIKVRKQILKECDVILSLIRNCHDEFMGETFIETESVSQMCCIVDEANLCTEPETLIPVLHGISKLILIGDPDYPAKVLSKTANSYDYSQSFFQRAYDLDLITE